MGVRKTLILERDVIERLQRKADVEKRPFKQLVNETLRRGLGLTQPPRKQVYRVQPHSSEFGPGVDQAHLNRLVDELELSGSRGMTQPG